MPLFAQEVHGHERLRAMVLTLLAETPPRIAELMAGLGPDQLHAPRDRDEWSANDVLAHLRACADVWGNRVVAITTEDAPTLWPVSSRTWIKKELPRTGISFLVTRLCYVAR